MSIASIKAGKAFYEIFAEDKTSKGLSSAEQALMRFGTKIGLVGASMAAFSAAALTGMTALIKGFADTGDVLGDAMGQTGFSGEFLQSLKFAAADVGVQFELLRGSISKAQKLIAEAAMGNKTAIKRFDELGMSVADIARLSPDEQFLALADAIASIEDPAQKAKAAMDIFGKSGARMLPMLNAGAKGLSEQFEDLKSRGLILSEKDIELAGRADGAFLLFTTTLRQISDLLGAALAPAFIEIMKVVQSTAEAVATFINNNRTLVVWIAGGVVAIGALGIVLMGLGAVCIGASLATTGLTMALAAMGTVAAFLASPLFVITAAIVACGVAALVSAYYMDLIYNSGGAFDFLKESVLGAWEAIKLLWTAVSNGRWDLAGKLIGEGLAVGFYGAILAIKEAWQAMVNWMADSIAKAVAKIEASLPKWVIDKMGGGFANTANDMAAIVRQDGDAKLTDDRKRVTDSVAAMLNTTAAIRGLDETIKAERAAKAGLAGAVSDFGTQSSIVSGSVGATISSNAARLGFAAPANSIDEKQLEVLNQIKGGVDDLLDGVEGLEGLTAD